MKILIKNGPGKGQVIKPTHSRIAVGRSRDSDIPLLGDLRASRKHCEILRRGWHWTIVDMGSTNGTFVNGEPITRPTVLQHGDVIQIGACELVALNEPEAGTHENGGLRIGGRLFTRLRHNQAAAVTLS